MDRSSSSLSECSTRSRSSDSDRESDLEDPEPVLFESSANPSETREYAWVYCLPPKKLPNEHVLGKWLLFRPFSEIDETWHMITREIENGLLTESTRGAKCSGLYFNPTCGGPGPKTSGVICVYTTEENVDKAGFILINMVEHDIKYKTDEATLDREYAWKGGGKSVCLKTLYWNNGEPSFELRGAQCRGPRCHGIKDEWRINRVSAPESIMNNCTVYGRWVLVMESDWDVTGYWQTLRKVIEKGKLGPVEMVCPPKRNFRDPNEEIVFLVYTGYENKESVGLKLASYAQKDLSYELSPRSLRHSHNKPVYSHRITLINDEPVYVMTLIRPRSYK